MHYSATNIYDYLTQKAHTSIVDYMLYSVAISGKLNPG